MYLLQDWTTIAGRGTEPFVQSIRDWADLARFGDVVLWLEVRAVANPAGGNVQLLYETSPVIDDATFASFATFNVTAGTSPTITKLQTSSNPATPLARWLRWKLTGTASGDWSACFRIFVCGGRSTAGTFDPSSLNLTGWWRASYGGSPWTPTASAGSSGSNGNLANAGSPPAVGSAVNGYTPAAADGVNDFLLSSSAGSTFLSASAYSAWALVNATSVATNDLTNVYANAGIVGSNTNQQWGAGMCSSGQVGVYQYDGSSFAGVYRAFSIGSWQLVQWKFDGTNLSLRVNGGAWASVAKGNVAGLTDAVLVCESSYSSLFANVQVLELALTNTALPDATFDNVKAYANARYALSL